MNQLLKAAIFHYEAQKSEALAHLEIVFNNPVGIGEHTDYGAEGNMYCTPNVQSNWVCLSEFEQKCSEEHSCYQFYRECGRYDDFKYCLDAAELKSSSCGSILYEQGNSLCLHGFV